MLPLKNLARKGLISNITRNYIKKARVYAFVHGPLTGYIKLWVAHGPGMPGTFSLPPQVSDPNIHHGTCMTHVSWCMPGSLTSGFLLIRWRGKRFQHSRCLHNGSLAKPQLKLGHGQMIIFIQHNGSNPQIIPVSKRSSWPLATARLRSDKLLNNLINCWTTSHDTKYS